MQTVSASPAAARIEVHKFGGTSVGDAARMDAVAELALGLASRARPVIVASAMSGVTNALLAAAKAAAAGDHHASLARLAEILTRHSTALERWSGAGVPREEIDAARRHLESMHAELSDLVRGVVAVRELSARVRDRILGAGEKLSVRLVALALRARGLDAVAVDADGFLETDGVFGGANPVRGVVELGIRAALLPLLHARRIPIVTGFIGHAPDGATTTFSRGGSDYTATILAAALRADEVTIWTDVDGVYTADPRIVPEARSVPQLNFREAAELSYYGAKVLHQRTIIPVANLGIPIWIRNSFEPESAGTVVNGQFTPGSHPVKAISAVKGQALVSVEGKGMAGVPGIAARVFQSLAADDINVTMISQSSSESSICLVVAEEDAARAELTLKRAFRDALGAGDVEEISSRPGVALLAAVGLGMAHVPGIAARIFQALGGRRINVLAIAQGSSELNISIAVDRSDVDAAVRALHSEFELDRLDTGEDTARRFDLILLGAGAIGRALIRQFVSRREQFLERFGLDARVVAVADRGGFVFQPTGLSELALEQLCEWKQARHSFAELAKAGSAVPPLDGLAGAAALAGNGEDLLREVFRYRVARPVVIDVTDGDDTIPLFLGALERGADLVTANKKPIAGPAEAYRTLLEETRRSGRLLKAEATVGAGLPIMDTLEMLLLTGDRLVSAEGCFSGTLGYVVSRLEEGARFSDAVFEAAERGFTEPDPVVDLAGADVARKAVILGRLSGLADDGTTVRLEGLVDSSLLGLERTALFERLRALDQDFARRVAQAKESGHALRFAARVERNKIDVGPRLVPLASPLAQLRGTDNMIVFESERYRTRPLVLSGPGAGAEVTAMGVLSDIFRVAAERSAA